MTERKPKGVRFESWVEKQIREATELGSLDDLPGAGKPLPPADADELAWVRDKVRREGLPVTALLPPSLAVVKEVEDLPALLARMHSERAVRELLGDVNRRIDAAGRGPAIGPPVRTALLDVDAEVERWRARRPAPPPAEVAAAAPLPDRRQWLSRRSKPRSG
jgi:hypothetical protein